MFLAYEADPECLMPGSAADKSVRQGNVSFRKIIASFFHVGSDAWRQHVARLSATCSE